MKITNFSTMPKTEMREFISKAVKMLEPLGKEYGVVITRGNASYTESELSMKMLVRVIGTDGVINNAETDAFKAMAKYYGLEATDLGKTFQQGDKILKVVGLNTRASKTPIIVQSQDGTHYRMEAKTVSLYLRSTKA